MEQEQITISKEEYQELVEKAKKLDKIEGTNEEDIEEHLDKVLDEYKQGKIIRLA